VKGKGTNEFPYEGCVFGWCGGTGAAVASANQVVIRIPRGKYNWMQIKKVVVMTVGPTGVGVAPMVGISDGAGNIDSLGIGEFKFVTQGEDYMVWDDIDMLFRIDFGLDENVADSMSNLLSLTGSSVFPCVTIGVTDYSTIVFNFMVQLEWVEL